jgi:SAM-dependent methyltransferase
MIDFVSPNTGLPLIKQDKFLVSESGEKFPLISDIPRFVGTQSYADAFGFQWNSYARTQLDSHTGKNFSLLRLERCLGFPVAELKGKNVLEVGCGAGRFTELLVKSGALTHSVDLSSAVEANKRNIGSPANYSIAQANVYSLPYPKRAFEVVICLGVIQHTPSSEKTIQALWEMVKPGGLLVIDHYIFTWGYFTNLNPFYRFFLKRMKPERAKVIVDKLVDFFFPLHWKFKDVRYIPFFLYRLGPINFYYHYLPGQTREFYYEWSKLDTYDYLTDYYKHLKTPSQIKKILNRLKGATDIFVAKGGNGIEGRCRKES